MTIDWTADGQGSWLAQAGLAQAGTGSAPPPGPALSSETPGAPSGTTGQPAGGVVPGPGPQTRPSAGGFDPIMLILFVVLMFILLTTMTGRKDKRRRAALLAGLVKNDKVLTVGGVIGTIVELHDDEIVLRTDESTNSRLRLTRSSVQQVLRGSRDKPDEKPGAKPEVVEAKPAAPVRV
ncbi:MAG: preprotein translocase subunit YajC [Phycisphaerales bacterium]